MKKKLLCTLLTLCMLVGTLADNYHFNFVKADEIQNSTNVKTGDTIKYDGDSFQVIYEITSLWNGAYNVSVTLKNTGTSTIHNWALLYDMETNNITNIWNATIANNENGLYLINNNNWNMDIAVNSSVQFGYTAPYTDNLVSLPKTFKLTTCETEVPKNNYETSFAITSTGGGQLTANITIKNISSKTITDWSLKFTYKNKIYNMWGASLEEQEQKDNEYIYQVRNPGWTQNLDANSEYTFGFQAKSVDEAAIPYNFEMKCYDNSIIYDTDTDGDGLDDATELIYGTDINNPDTDGDSLNDGLEVYILGYDPTNIDTDGNGISDAYEDTDEDGLTNIYEVSAGLNPGENDTDSDGLNDGEEINTYKTNPLLDDTDGDTLLDGSEIALKFNPCKKDTNNNGITDDKEFVQQKISENINENANDGAITNVTLKMNVTGDATENTEIENIFGEDILSSNVEGLIGVPININCTGKLDKATITFNYNPEKLGNTSEDDLAILWYDEKNDNYVIYDKEAVLDKTTHTISYTTNHFSTYMVVNKKTWYAVWRNEINYRTTNRKKKFVDVVLTIDASGSMKGSEIVNAKKALNEFTDAKRNKDRLSVVKFTGEADIIGKFKKSKTKIKKDINKIKAGGKTDVDKGLKKAIKLYTEKEYKNVGNKKDILLICDGDLEYNQEIVNLAKKNKISIYTILIGKKNKSALKKISTKTGGAFKNVEKTSDLSNIMFKMEDNIMGAIDKTDSDKDGIFDVYEEKGMFCSNGKIIKTNKNKKDSDGDGLSDYYEFTCIKYIGTPLMPGNKTIYNKRTKEYIDASYFPFVRSNPTKKDSDNDEYNDKIDKKPLHKATKLIGIKNDREFVPINISLGETLWNENWNNFDLSYGGDQGWWSGKINNEGCGIIAAANILFYQSRKGKKISAPFSKTTYKKTVDELSNNIPLLNGAVALTIKRGLKAYWRIRKTEKLYNIDIDVMLFSSEKKSNQLFKKIKTNLKKKNPVILSVGGNIRGNKTKHGPEMFKLEKNSLIKFEGSRQYFDEHYVTITGILTNEQDNTYRLQVSSWGEKYYIKYHDIYPFVKNHSLPMMCDAIFVAKNKSS